MWCIGWLKFGRHILCQFINIYLYIVTIVSNVHRHRQCVMIIVELDTFSLAVSQQQQNRREKLIHQMGMKEETYGLIWSRWCLEIWWGKWNWMPIEHTNYVTHVLGVHFLFPPLFDFNTTHANTHMTNDTLDFQNDEHSQYNSAYISNLNR